MYYRFILPLNLLLLACNGKEKQEKENEDEQYAKIEQQDEKTIVKVQVAQEDRFNLELVSNGKAEANRKAVLNFEVADVVRKVNVKNGDRVRKGDIIARMSGDVGEVENSITSSLDMLMKSPIMIILYFATLVITSWQLTLFTIVVLPGMGWLMGVVGRKLKRQSLEAQSKWSDTMSQLEETLGGLRII